MPLIQNWRQIELTKAHVDLKTLLNCGQSFSWKETSEDIWSNVLSGVVFSLRQTFDHLCWSTPIRDEQKPHGDSGDSITDEQAKAILMDYFQLDIDLPSLYRQWSLADKNFSNISDKFPGIRIMRQDPTENLFSFICSSNNHVSRISGMVNKLAQHFGTEMGTVDKTIIYGFPSAQQLDDSKVEAKLRELGFGYR